MTVQLNLTTLDACDTAGGGSWVVFNISGAMGTLQDVTTTSEDMTVNIEGSQCYGFDCDKESGGYEYPMGTTTDMSNMTIYIWVSIPTALGGLVALNPGSGQSGLFLTARDSSGNRGYWHVAGNDTWDGAWKCFKAYLGNSPDTNSGTAPNTTLIDYIGFGINHPNAKSKAACNIFFDAIRYGNDGVTLYGGSAGSELDFDDIVTGDLASAMGIIRKSGGVYFLNGPITFGHDSQSCYFKDTGKVVVFEDTPHTDPNLYKLEIIEGASQVTQFQLGDLSGTQGIQGGFITAAGSQSWDLLCSGELVDKFKLYGATVGRAKDIVLSYSGEKTVLSCGFQNQGSGEIYPSGISFTYNNIITPTEVGLVIDDGAEAIPSYCNFISCPVGMEFRGTASGEFGFTYDVFTNCTIDIRNSLSGELVDKYPESYFSADIDCANGYNSAIGQSFTGNGLPLANVSWYMRKNGTPPGNVIAEVFAHTGTYGTSSVPTGTALATSIAKAATSLQTSDTWEVFNFDDSDLTLTNGTYYVATLRYTGYATAEYLTNDVALGLDHTSPVHGGNASRVSGEYGGAWSALAYDMMFGVAGGAQLKINATNSNPTAYENTDPISPGCTVITNTVTHTLTDIIAGSEVTYVSGEGPNAIVLTHTESVGGGGSVNYNYNYTGNFYVDILVMHLDYEPFQQTVLLGSTSQSLPISQVSDRIYSP